MENKEEILLIALQERYLSLHTIRERIQIVALWILGLLVAGAGWLFQADLDIGLAEKISLSIGVFILWMVLRSYFKDLERGFNGQRRVLIKIEDALGFFKEGYFDNSEDSLYPISWKEVTDGNFIKNNYNLIALGFFFLIASILLPF